jgi:hypothetical protein
MRLYKRTTNTADAKIAMLGDDRDDVRSAVHSHDLT